MKSILLVVVLLTIVLAEVRLPLTRVPGMKRLSRSTGVPVGGGVAQYGEYFVTVDLGTPPQQLSFQIDTGSTDLLVYAGDCNGCPAGADTFNYQASSTAKLVKCSSSKYQCQSCYNGSICSFDDAYGDGSDVNGFVVQDQFQFASGSMAATVTLGSIENATPNFEPTGVDGIFGLAHASISSWGANSPLIEFMKQNSLPVAFSLCLQNTSGSMGVGLTSSELAQYIWTAQTSDQYYTVHLVDMQVSGQSLGLDPSILNGQYDALVDSGTTLIIVPDAVIQAVQSAFMTLCNNGVDLPGVCSAPPGQGLFDGNCVPMTSAQLNNFPQIGFTPNGISKPLNIGPNIYLIHQGGDICLGMASSGGLGAITILGDTFMRAYKVAFDLQSHRVGFAAQKGC